MNKYDFQDVHNKVIADLFRNFEFKYTNRKDKVGDIMQCLFNMFKNIDVFSAGLQVRGCSEFIDYFLNFKHKYEVHLQGAEYAVIFVDKDTIKLIKQNSSMYNLAEPVEYYPSDDDFFVDTQCVERPHNASSNIVKKSVFDRVIGVKITPPFNQVCELLGCYTVMSKDKLQEYGVKADTLMSAPEQIPTIVLCEENMQALSKSLDEDDFNEVNRIQISDRFGVNVENRYFDYNIERIVFAHEFAHLLLRHDTNGVKMMINRETQANCLASILLNDPIASIYIKYLTYFQPLEYQRTLLMYNDFDVCDMLKKLKFVVELK